jgi:hypothetical protein
MRRVALTLIAASAMACVSLPRQASYTSSPTDAFLLEGQWRGEFSRLDGQRGGSMTLALEVRNDTARGPVVLAPVVYVAAEAGASAPMRAEARSILRSPIHFVSVTDGVVTGVVPAFFDTERLVTVQMTFIGRMRSWNVIEGTYVALGPNLRIEELGTWRVVRGK